jgi:hypothetical protein
MEMSPLAPDPRHVATNSSLLLSFRQPLETQTNYGTHRFYLAKPDKTVKTTKLSTHAIFNDAASPSEAFYEDTE